MDDATFHNRVLPSADPVLILFTAPWCGPSIFMREDTEIAMGSLPENVVLAEVDIETCPKATQTTAVKGTPWLALVQAGKPLASMVGTLTPEQIVAWVDKTLNPPPPKAKKKKKAD